MAVIFSGRIYNVDVYCIRACQSPIPYATLAESISSLPVANTSTYIPSQRCLLPRFVQTKPPGENTDLYRKATATITKY
ncbi:unnamed protein product [Cylicocyclus nassatus]|uniref:Uncharacterized protein n=1 Tax=Cylicocyclus nassatus TaxID=53992 RepID=A0AA36M8H3_CYLNA|nr:unnamed protein product [Cylicocyclus nassatus]